MPHLYIILADFKQVRRFVFHKSIMRWVNDPFIEQICWVEPPYKANVLVQSQ